MKNNLDTKWIIGAVTVPVIVAVIGYLANRPSEAPKEKETPLLTRGYDFTKKASEATWSNGSKELPVPGERSDRDGFVYLGSFDSVPLENGGKVRSFLQTHPEWTPHGIIEGKYGPFKIDDGLQIIATVGFLQGAHATDGVEFRIEFESEENPQRQTMLETVALYSGKLDTISADLAPFAAKTGYIILQVDALTNSDQDWAVWESARIAGQ